MEIVGFFQIYELRVMETKPDKAVSIIECDMNVRSQTTLEYSVSYSTENSMFPRWILMPLWVTKNQNGNLRTKRNQL